MKVIWKVLLVWGLLDSLWLALSPGSWSRIWGKGMKRIARDRRLSYGFAALELATCLYLFGRECKLGCSKNNAQQAEL